MTHELMAAGSIIAFYSNVPRMLELAVAALRNLPGVEDCHFVAAGHAVGVAPVTQAPSDTSAERELYRVRLSTGAADYGELTVTVADRAQFGTFEAAVHNFANAVALRIENLDYQQTLEERVREQTAEIEESRTRLQALLDEKELLLREVHHRVKNNLFAVISLLRMQFDGFADPEVQAGVQATVERIQSTALVHELLYRADGVRAFSFRDFIGRLLTQLDIGYKAVRIESAIADLSIEFDQAVPIGLILNEVVTNALKYAFPDGREGAIRIAARRLSTGPTDDQAELEVWDNGVGFPAAFEPSRSRSLGMQLIHGLAAQIGGTVTIGNADGVHVRLLFPLAHASGGVDDAS